MLADCLTVAVFLVTMIWAMVAAVIGVIVVGIIITIEVVVSFVKRALDWIACFFTHI